MNEQQLSDAIATLPGERVTKEQMESRIKEVTYHRFGVTVTFCNILLDNGYSVRGESACVDPENYRQDIGEKLAYDDAFRKLWPLFGFLLAEKRHRHIRINTHLERIAYVCHEVNRAICQAQGDQSQPLWNYAPDWQRESAINGVNFHLDNPNASPSASHDAWMAHKQADGWVHGEVKDAEAKTHPCIVPYDLLPFEQRVKDYAFKAVVHAMVRL